MQSITKLCGLFQFDELTVFQFNFNLLFSLWMRLSTFSYVLEPFIFPYINCLYSLPIYLQCYWFIYIFNLFIFNFLYFRLKWIWSYYPWEKAYSWWIFDLDNSAFGLDPGEWLKFLLKFVQVAQWVRLFCAMLLLKEEIFTVERCLSFFCAASSAIKLHHVS